MKLGAYCTNCNTLIPVKIKSGDRVTFSKNNGKEIKLYCPSCEKNQLVHVEDIFAQESKIAIITSLIVLIGGLFFIFFYVADLLIESNSPQTNLMVFELFAAIAIPALIYFTIQSEEKKKVRIFNSSRI